MSQEFDDVAAVTFDRDDDSVVVIVGSGAGGGTLANELAQKGIDVVVLEAGPRFQATDFENNEYAMDDKLTWRDKRLCTGTSPIAENFAEAPTWVCKGVGGTTLHWTGTCVRFQDFEFNARTTYGDIAGASVADWPLGLADLAPYYDRAEDKLGVSGTNGIPFHPPGNNYRVMAAGARRIGYTQVDTNRMAINPRPRDGRNACDQIGFCMQGCRSGAKWSTFNTEIPKAEATGRCEIRPDCMALRIEHDARGRAAGVLYVEGSGARHLQKARAVCVAGNAIDLAGGPAGALACSLNHRPHLLGDPCATAACRVSFLPPALSALRGALDSRFRGNDGRGHRQARASRSSRSRWNSSRSSSVRPAGSVTRMLTSRSPLAAAPVPCLRGIPFPLSRNTRPFCVSGGIVSATFRPVIVGASTSPPSIATASGVSTLTDRSSPLRSNVRCGLTVTWR